MNGRARYLTERSILEDLGATAAFYEEAAVALPRLLLQEVGADEERLKREAEDIRREFALRKRDPSSSLSATSDGVSPSPWPPDADRARSASAEGPDAPGAGTIPWLFHRT